MDLFTSDVHSREWESLAQLRSAFEWDLPDSLNAADHLCDRWARTDGERAAIYYEDETVGREGQLTFAELADATDRLAGYLRAAGVEPGDFVAINVARKPETVVSHLAAWKLGAVSAPLSVLFGPEALAYRLDDCEPLVAIVDAANVENVRTAADRTATAGTRLVVGVESLEDESLGADEREFWSAVDAAEPIDSPVGTTSDDPMLLMYSSGTTGPPKGIVQCHRTVVAHLPGAITNYYNLDVAGDEVWWTPAEWAWGAFLSVMIDALFFGRPIVASESGASFDPVRACEVLERFEITHAFLPPSALRLMRQSNVGDREWAFDTFRLLTSGGESLDGETRLWAESFFDVTVHEGYGSTEMFNHIIGDCTALEPATPGWMGYALPGHRIQLLDPETRAPVDVGETGEIALSRDDPTLFEEYLGRPEATAAAYHGEWYLTGDLARRNEAGQFQHVGRVDDLIICSGYRIGPSEIESALTGHAAVAEVGVVGVPDDERGEVPKAFVVLDPEHDPSDRLRTELQDYVRDRLASYEYPREIAFVAALPRTTTGKLKRGDLTDLPSVEDD